MATASKYDTLADAILTGVGGESNVKTVTHCATRLRFQLNDQAKADKAAVEAVPGSSPSSRPAASSRSSSATPSTTSTRR